MSKARLLESLDVIAECPDGLDRIRRAIIGLATSGQLLPRSGASSAKSLQVGAELPSHWKVQRLDEIAKYGGNGAIAAKDIPKSAWLLDLEDIEKTSGRLLKQETANNRRTTSSKAMFQAGDVLYGKLRPYLDKVIVAEQSGYCTTEIVPIRPYELVDPYWLRLCLKRPAFLEFVDSKSYGMKMPRLGTKDATSSLHPVPPLEEQKRIIAKVDELMALCDQLEERKNQRDSIRTAFASTITRVS